MDKTNPKTVEQKLFSAKPSAERLNEEIKEKILKIREKGLKKLKYGHSNEKEEISGRNMKKSPSSLNISQNMFRIPEKSRQLLIFRQV